MLLMRNFFTKRELYEYVNKHHIKQYQIVCIKYDKSEYDLWYFENE